MEKFSLNFKQETVAALRITRRGWKWKQLPAKQKRTAI
jgi:hypothetical protein